MRLCIVGPGRWGKVYASTLEKMEIPHSIGKTWGNCDGVIVATPAETHYGIAKAVLAEGIPLLLEKPITLDPKEAWDLVKLRGIAFAGHTRIYSPAWREFKRGITNPKVVRASAGGTHRDPWWDWGPHLAAMCLDVGVDPRAADICVSKETKALRFEVDGRVFTDHRTDPTPLEVLISEFVAAIERGEPDNRGLILGAKVVEFLHGAVGLYDPEGCDSLRLVAPHGPYYGHRGLHHPL